MPIIEIVNGNLLDASEPYIAQQCNCCTVKSHGLSASISKEFPWADVYKRRKLSGKNKKERKITIPGTIEIDSCPSDNLKVIHMFAQYSPGKPNSFSRYYKDDDIEAIKDSFIDRQKYFKECLDLIDNDPNITIVAMPYLIGCGLAGGSWSDYEKLLNDSVTDIVLYKI